MSLVDGLFAIGLYVPLSTLSLRILIDALSFNKFVQRQIQRIRTIQRLNHELCVQQALQISETSWLMNHDNDAADNSASLELEPVPHRELSLAKNHNLYVIQTDRRRNRNERAKNSAKVILLCSQILQLHQSKRGVFNVTTVELMFDQPLKIDQRGATTTTGRVDDRGRHNNNSSNNARSITLLH